MKILITGASGFIGTNFIDHLIENGIYNLINLDKNSPLKKSHQQYWQECNILNIDDLFKQFHKFKPSHVLHLAARTDTNSNLVGDYTDNTIGTINVLKAVENTSTVDRIIITSTQYVYRPGEKTPKNDEDYDPHTAYGESKVLNEKAIRHTDISCVWTIIRPTNIWGPWHLRYRDQFLKIMSRRQYLHPGSQDVIRSYGYVGNVVDQIYKIFKAPKELVDGQVYYVGDYPLKLIDWVNGFSQAMHDKNVIVVPRVVVKTIALLGDVLKIMGIQFPITSSRYKSMIQNYLTPMDKTIKVFGPSRFTLNEGISETINWLKNKY